MGITEMTTNAEREDTFKLSLATVNVGNPANAKITLDLGHKFDDEWANFREDPENVEKRGVKKFIFQSQTSDCTNKMDDYFKYKSGCSIQTQFNINNKIIWQVKTSMFPQYAQLRWMIHVPEKTYGWVRVVNNEGSNHVFYKGPKASSKLER